MSSGGMSLKRGVGIHVEVNEMHRLLWGLHYVSLLLSHNSYMGGWRLHPGYS